MDSIHSTLSVDIPLKKPFQRDLFVRNFSLLSFNGNNDNDDNYVRFQTIDRYIHIIPKQPHCIKRFSYTLPVQKHFLAQETDMKEHTINAFRIWHEQMPYMGLENNRNHIAYMNCSYRIHYHPDYNTGDNKNFRLDDMYTYCVNTEDYTTMSNGPSPLSPPHTSLHDRIPIDTSSDFGSAITTNSSATLPFLAKYYINQVYYGENLYVTFTDDMKFIRVVKFNDRPSANYFLNDLYDLVGDVFRYIINYRVYIREDYHPGGDDIISTTFNNNTIYSFDYHFGGLLDCTETTPCRKLSVRKGRRVYARPQWFGDRVIALYDHRGILYYRNTEDIPTISYIKLPYCESVVITAIVYRSKTTCTNTLILDETLAVLRNNLFWKINDSLKPSYEVYGNNDRLGIDYIINDTEQRRYVAQNEMHRNLVQHASVELDNFFTVRFHKVFVNKTIRITYNDYLSLNKMYLSFIKYGHRITRNEFVSKTYNYLFNQELETLDRSLYINGMRFYSAPTLSFSFYHKKILNEICRNDLKVEMAGLTEITLLSDVNFMRKQFRIGSSDENVVAINRRAHVDMLSVYRFRLIISMDRTYCATEDGTLFCVSGLPSYKFRKPNGIITCFLDESKKVIYCGNAYNCKTPSRIAEIKNNQYDV